MHGVRAISLHSLSHLKPERLQLYTSHSLVKCEKSLPQTPTKPFLSSPGHAKYIGRKAKIELFPKYSSNFESITCISVKTRIYFWPSTLRIFNRVNISFGIRLLNEYMNGSQCSYFSTTAVRISLTAFGMRCCAYYCMYALWIMKLENCSNIPMATTVT